jgi:hypothetical protein
MKKLLDCFRRLFKGNMTGTKEVNVLDRSVHNAARLPIEGEEIEGYDFWANHIKKILAILGIKDCPDIKIMGYIWTGPFEEVAALRKFYESDLLTDSKHPFLGEQYSQGGYYFDSDNLILVSRKAFDPNKKFPDSTLAELVFNLAHELRHCWQYYNDTEQYKKYSCSEELLFNPIENDADAFALAYVLSSETNYTYKDLPHELKMQRNHSQFNGGILWKRALVLARKYSLDSGKAIMLISNSRMTKKKG